MAWEDRYKYLGVKAGANSTPDLEKLGRDYIEDVEAITRSELTDWQKLDAIHRFAKISFPTSVGKDPRCKGKTPEEDNRCFPLLSMASWRPVSPEN